MDSRVLITGASSDVGRSIALKLGGRASGLGLHYHRNADAVASLERELVAGGCAVHPLPYDLSEPAGACDMVKEFMERFGRMDALINVVGPFDYRPVEELSVESWHETISLNLHACFHVLHYAQPHLCDARGHIVNFLFAGCENVKGWPMSTAYCAAKAGVAVLTKSLAVALAPRQVRVNAICPGLVEETTSTTAERQSMAEQIPLGRPVRPQEIASTVDWLVYDSPASLTGAFIAVSGAWEY